MKRILFFLLLVINLSAFGQVPSGYTQAGWRYKVKAFIFDSALHVPQYNGTPSGIRNGAWVGDGAVAVDTVNNLFYFRSSGAWHSTSSGSGWSLTGNAGTTSSNFIGTTDAQPLMFRYNNLNAGSIGKSSGGTYLGIGAGENDNAEDEPNVGVGYYALYYNTTGNGNSAVGNVALYNNTTGSYNSVVGFSALASNTTGDNNSAVGIAALTSNTTGYNNSAVGIAALASNTTGYNNSAVGASAGNNAKQKPDAKYQTLLGSSTYGTRDSITVLGASFIKETIVRGKLIDSTLSAGSGTKAVRWNSSTGEFTYADTTVGGGGGGLTIGTTTIANSATGSILYDSSGILSRNADLYWDVSNKRLGIGTSTPATKFHTVGTVRHQTLGTAITDTTTYKPLVINSSGDVLPSTYWYGGGGGSPAGSNRQVQYNNSGAFGGATGVEIGNTNERLTVTSQATSEAALTVKQVGQYVGINIKPSDASTPYSPLLSFSQSVNSVGARMGLDAGVFKLEGSFSPYGFQNQQEVAFGSFYSGDVANFRVHTYAADVPASPDDWTIRVRTPKTAAVGQVIDWGAAGQTGDLLQFRKNDNTVLSRFDSVGNLGLGVAPTTKLDVGGTFAARQGADVASANNLAVVANSTEITGTTQVNLIANTGWVNGSQITLLLASGITIKNGQTTSGSNITILLDGAADFVTSAASSLTLLLCEVGGTQAWREISRRSY